MPSILDSITDIHVGYNLVLNLVINGMPSILANNNITSNCSLEVLNLVINGMPSIQNRIKELLENAKHVLNLVINGMPSIL